MEREVRTLLHPDGKRRIVVVQRADGLYGFRQDKLITAPQGEKWWPFLRYSTICDSVEIAEREARAQVDWLHPRRS